MAKGNYLITGAAMAAVVVMTSADAKSPPPPAEVASRWESYFADSSYSYYRDPAIVRDGTNASLWKVAAHGVGGIAHGIDRFAQLLLAHAERGGPVADFIIFAEADPAAVGGAHLIFVVCHDVTPLPTNAPEALEVAGGSAR